MKGKIRVLLVGSRGFIGTRLVTQCACNALELMTTDKVQLVETGDDFLISTDQGLLTRETMLQGVDVVVYLAWSGSPAEDESKPVTALASALTPLLRWLDDISKMSAPPLFIFFSTGGLIYQPDREVPRTETSPLGPSSIYGLNKFYAEQVISQYSARYGFKTIICRPSNPYGPAQRGRGKQGLIAAIFKAALSNDVLTVWGDGSAVRDYIFVDDVGAWVKRAIELWMNGGIAEEGSNIFNISSGVGTSILDLIGMIEEISGQKVHTYFEPTRDFDQQYVVLDSSLARDRFDWQPEVPLSVGLMQTHRWYRQNGF